MPQEEDKLKDKIEFWIQWITRACVLQDKLTFTKKELQLVFTIQGFGDKTVDGIKPSCLETVLVPFH
jgi:hypothetical protein